MESSSTEARLEERRLEARVRQLALRKSFRVSKARGRQHLNNRGLFQLIELRSNSVALGVDFDATLEEIRKYLLDGRS